MPQQHGLPRAEGRGAGIGKTQSGFEAGRGRGHRAGTTGSWPGERQWHCSRLACRRESAADADWLIGEGIFTDEVEGTALRSLKAPGTAYDDDVLGKDPQPAHMNDFVETDDDNGGVHINSGIPNRAFYLAAAAIGGNAWERAGRIWYETLTSEIKATTDFGGFADATVEVAVRLYGAESPEAAAVRTAWGEVGVMS